jgi:signal peptidase I
MAYFPKLSKTSWISILWNWTDKGHQAIPIRWWGQHRFSLLDMPVSSSIQHCFRLGRTIGCQSTPRANVKKRTFSTSAVRQDDKKSLSRTDRRKLERTKRNQAKKEAKQPSTQQHSLQGTRWGNSLRPERVFQSMVPRIPGRGERMTQPHWMALAYRFPLFLVLCLLFTDERTSPYIIQASLGPSMLPTIQFVGDIWLVQTGAWSRAWRWLRGEKDPSIDVSSYQVGDLVLWKDPKTERVSCKRIVGLGGDRVKMYGEYLELYQNRSDLGIVWPSDAAARGLQSKKSFMEEIQNAKQGVKGAVQCTVVIPENHVWLEGDCPLFSVDSRHYGPIPVSTLCGRLVFRLWPWNRDEMVHDPHNAYVSSCWINRQRPVPYPTVEPYLGKKFGFYRESKLETGIE